MFVVRRHELIFGGYTHIGLQVYMRTVTPLRAANRTYAR